MSVRLSIQKLFKLFEADGQTKGNTIVPLPHFVRRGTKICMATCPSGSGFDVQICLLQEAGGFSVFWS